jgi:MFS family permease
MASQENSLASTIATHAGDLATTDERTQVNHSFVIMISVIATIGGFLFGYDSGVINGTVDGLRLAFHSDSMGTGFSVSSMLLGCAAGAFFAGQAADKTRGLVGQGLERGSEALANVSRLVGDTAAGLDERLGEEYGDYARKAATAIDDVANSLASKDPDELIDDTRNFVRKSPGMALAGAAIVGFALARLVKSGLDDSRGRNRGDED